MTDFDRAFEIVTTLEHSACVVTLPNIDIFFADLPKGLYDYLESEINKIKSNFESGISYNQTLAGHIKHEYRLMHCIPKIEEFVMKNAIWYFQEYNLDQRILTGDCPLRLYDLWVNFQRKHEFNPPHKHGGVISFVIWMKVPFNLEDEMAYFPHGTADQTSRFGFLTTNRVGEIQSTTIPIDKKFEGKICFFPSRMVHYVNPFYTSDDYRISISGNIHYDVGQYALKDEVEKVQDDEK